MRATQGLAAWMRTAMRKLLEKASAGSRRASARCAQGAERMDQANTAWSQTRAQGARRRRDWGRVAACAVQEKEREGGGT